MIGLGTPILYESHAASGYRPRPDQTRRRLGGARVHVNRLGVRGPDVADAPPPGTVRLLFLGDSVTWGGSYVDDEDLFAAVASDRVRTQLRRPTEWLDAGVNAWGPQNVVGLLHETNGFASQVWIWTLLDDDFWRQQTHLGEVPYFAVAPWTAWEELLMLASYEVVTHYKLPRPPAESGSVAATNLDAIRAVTTAARTADARLLLVWHPTAPALTGVVEPNRDPLARLANETHVPFVDLTTAYRASSATLYADGMHLSRAGHAVAGAAIGDAVVTMLRDAR